MYKVHVGFTPKGRDKWRTFESLEKANAYCERVRQKTGHFLAIVAA